MTPYRLIHRFVCPVDFLSRLELEETGKRVHINRSTVGVVCTARGVPAKRVDFVIPTYDFVLNEGIVEIGIKAGMYDGTQRTRITARSMDSMDSAQVQMLPRGRIEIQFSTNIMIVTMYDAEGCAIWTGRYERARYTLDPALRPGQIIGWHAQHYYQHLTDAQRGEAVATFQIPPGSSITEANRMASRHLYLLSRQYGWRKFTQRERSKVPGLTSGQWHHESELVSLGYSPTGVGEYSLRSASGGSR